MSTTVQIQASSNFYELEGWNNTINNLSASGPDFNVGQDFHDATQFDWRTLVKFGIHTIPRGAVIEQVNIRAVATQDLSGTNFDVDIAKYDWSALDPITSGNMATAYAGVKSADVDQVWRSTSGMSINTQYTSPDLSTDFIKQQLEAGLTYFYYGWISSRDRAGNTPSGQEYIKLATKSHPTSSYRPILIVTYTGIARKFFVPSIIG